MVGRRIPAVLVAVVAAVALTLVATGTVFAQGTDTKGDIGAAVTDPYASMSHGTTCQPANLGQAQNYGASWNQLGITNPNPLGSGRSFYVVCSVPLADDYGTQPGATVIVNTLYADRDATKRVSCTGRRYQWPDTAPHRTVSASDTYLGAGTGPGEGYVYLPNLIRDVDTDYNFDTTASVVCALVPQATITSVTSVST